MARKSLSIAEVIARKGLEVAKQRKDAKVASLNKQADELTAQAEAAREQAKQVATDFVTAVQEAAKGFTAVAKG